MTPSQYTEVAEKVWGWKFDGKRIINGETFLIRVDKEEIVGLTGLRRDIESWQGFGRTVEAMAERDLVLIIDPSVGFCQIGRTTYNGGLMQKRTKEELWEATHLVALEAVREEGK